MFPRKKLGLIDTKLRFFKYTLKISQSAIFFTLKKLLTGFFFIYLTV